MHSFGELSIFSIIHFLHAHQIGMYIKCILKHFIGKNDEVSDGKQVETAPAINSQDI